MTIKEVESRLEQGLAKLRSREYQPLEALLQTLIPKGYRAHVSLADKKGRKKRKNASADNWSPALGEVIISFEPEAENSRVAIVEETLPDSELVSDSDFSPVDICGERLSATVLRQRR
jgi:hypothetical protein